MTKRIKKDDSLCGATGLAACGPWQSMLVWISKYYVVNKGMANLAVWILSWLPLQYV